MTSHEPTPKISLYSERMASFFSSDHKWTHLPDVEPERIARSVTWSDWPNKYMLEQSAEVKYTQPDRLSLERHMFQVLLISVARAPNDLHELERWCVVPTGEKSENVFYFRHLVEQIGEKPNEEMEHSVNFTIENGLHIPNDEDLEKLDSILEAGYEDCYKRID